MTAKKTINGKPLWIAWLIGIVGVGIILFILIGGGVIKLPSSAPVQPTMNVVEYRDVSVDMNGDGILDYVIFAQVIIVGENQNLP